MANRSYIYGLNNGKHHSMGEYPYFIPYAYRILAAFDNKAIDSHLFDKVVGIEADFLLGKEALYWLLDYLIASGGMKDPADFEKAVSDTKTFINAITADRILLENGEIYALDDADLEKTNEYACEDYRWIGEDIDNLKKIKLIPSRLFEIEDTQKFWPWLLELKNDWKEKLGLDSWRTILYFQFKENP